MLSKGLIYFVCVCVIVKVRNYEWSFERDDIKWTKYFFFQKKMLITFYGFSKTDIGKLFFTLICVTEQKLKTNFYIIKS